MGANVSTAIKNVNRDIQNISSANCRNATTVEQTIDGLNILLEGANCGNITVGNKAAVHQTCDLDIVAKTMAESLQEANLEQIQSLSLGGNISTDIQNNTTLIKNKLEAECGSDAAIRQKITNNTLTIRPYCYKTGPFGVIRKCIPASCDEINYINSANSVQQCVAKAFSEATDKISQVSTTKQSTSLISLGAGIVVILVIIVVVVLIKSSKGSKGTGTPAIPAGTGKPPAGTTTGATVTTGAKGFDYSNFVSGAANTVTSLISGQKKGQQLTQGGGRRLTRKSIAASLDGVPIIVLIILALVIYAKTH